MLIRHLAANGIVAARLCEVVANTDEDPALQAQVVASMIAHGVTALVISSAFGAEETTFGLLLRAAVPVMQVLRQVASFSFAAPDYRLGGP